MKKRVPFFLFVLGLCVTYGSVVFSAPAFGPGEYLDPPCAPGTTYLGDDCTVSLGWEVDTGNNFIFNDTANVKVGIGTDTPTATLSVVGDTDFSHTLIATPHSIADDGSISANLFSTTVTTSGDVEESSYKGISSIFEYAGADNIKGISSALEAPLIGIFSQVTNSSSGNLSNFALPSVTAGDFRAIQSGTGTVDEFTGVNILAGITSGTITDEMLGLKVTAVNQGSSLLPKFKGLSLNATNYGGNITDSYGISGSTNHSSTSTITNAYGTYGSVDNNTTGTITNAFGVGVNISNESSGEITNAFGISSYIENQSSGNMSLVSGISSIIDSTGPGSTLGFMSGINSSIRVESGTVNQAVGALIKIFKPTGSTGTINDAIGIQFDAGLWDTDLTSGIESANTAKGISFAGYDATHGAIEGTDVYGIYFGDQYALQGVDDEYALYVGDTDAENWFSNGLMIGDDTGGAPSLNSKIDDDNGGVGSTQLYIGTNTIDTTAPSDERTKENIESTIYGLDDLNQIDIVDFIYNQSIIDDNNEQHTGVLAQQVESIYPEAVSRRSDGYLMVDYKTFIPLTIRSIQELDIKVSDIEIMANETFVSRLRVWLASATNGIERIFAGRVETNEIQTDQLCVGSRCISESEFIELLDRNSVSGSSATGGDETDQEIEEEITENELEEELGTSSEEEVIEIESEDNVPLGLAEEESNISPESEEAIESSEQQEEEITETPSVSEEENNEAPSEDSGSEDEGDPVLE